ncbi:CotG/ExsB N-terminal domain-containing protein [Priestia aryabhattai]|uniref:CotG/ExsB N-terminal domain-containing protein n=1 Tax=Priestia aryabhattai TaxID=412384 RepID=UPI00203E8C1A|nr:hypothetical protein [Priestia aryabhattai]MCM3253692.1 hypothetical protein [Priestia aryabhattai]
MHITAQKIREAAESLSCTELETFMYQEPTSRRKSSRRRSTYRSTRRSTRRSSRCSTYRSTRRCQCGSPCCSYPWFNKSLGCCFKGHGCRR